MRTKQQHLWKSNPRCFSDTSSFRLSYRASSDEKFAVSFCGTFVPLLLYIFPLVDTLAAPDLGAGAVSWVEGSRGQRAGGNLLWTSRLNALDTWCTLGTSAWSRIYVVGLLKSLSRELQLHPPPSKKKKKKSTQNVLFFLSWKCLGRAQVGTLNHLWGLQTLPACYIH